MIEGAQGAAALPIELARPRRIVALGGGTGLPRVLSGLTGSGRGPEDHPLDVTAVVTTCDDGGSSGELRRLYQVPSPGDIRNCLVSLSAGSGPLASLFQDRFGGSGALAGHTVGNVVLTALTQQLGDFGAAVRAAADLLGVCGRVLPATDRCVELVATLDDGRVIRGESAIAAARGKVGRLSIEGPAPAPPAAIEALSAADAVVLGPGSLYSSIIASLLVDGLADALGGCRGLRVLVMNLFTQPGETDGYGAADHVRAIERHVAHVSPFSGTRSGGGGGSGARSLRTEVERSSPGNQSDSPVPTLASTEDGERRVGRVVDAVLVHGRPLPARLVESYAAQDSHPVRIERRALESMGVMVAEADLLSPDGETARHDPTRLASALLGLLG